MPEKLSPTNTIPVNESVQAIWRWRRVRAFLLSSASLFLLLALVWAWKVSAYRVDNNLAFRLNGSPEQLENLNNSLLKAMRNATTDDSLVGLVGSMKKAGELSSSILLESDLDTLRDRLKIYTREIENHGVCEARFSFVGNGSNEEAKFLSKLTENIYADLTSPQDLTHVDSAFSQVSDHLKAHLENQNRFSESFYNSVSELDQQLGRIREHLAQLGTTNIVPVAYTQEIAPPQPISEELVQELQGQNQFRHQHSSHELSSVERQIAIMRAKNARVVTQTIDDGFQNNEYFNEPSFDSVSFPKNNRQPNSINSQLALLNEEFQQLNTAGLYSVFDSIQSERNSDLSMPIEFIENFKTGLAERVQSGVTAPLAKPGTTKILPVGGLPSAEAIFWFTMASLMFGAAVVWRLNPSDSDRGFKDSSHLSESLGVPVVGGFPLQSPQEKTIPIASRIVSWCKIGLPIALLIIAACCLLNKSVWAQMFENPFHGLVRVVWFFKGH